MILFISIFPALSFLITDAFSYSTQRAFHFFSSSACKVNSILAFPLRNSRETFAIALAYIVPVLFLLLLRSSQSYIIIGSSAS